VALRHDLGGRPRALIATHSSELVTRRS
jgi:release factor glutamine methyltransferase